MNSETKICQNCKQSFVIEPEDFGFYERIKVPPPTFCPECRMVRRLMWRNERKLFRVKDNHSGKEIFSNYPKESGLKMYEDSYWVSDSWDAMNYGRDYDFSRPFFEQIKELIYVVPWDAMSVQRMVNSDYCNNASDLKNCYLCFNADRAEDCIYMNSLADCKSSVDSTQVDHLELCYEVFACAGCFKCYWSTELSNSHDAWFCKNCENVSNCFGCVNLRNKQYHIFNEPYSKEDYREKIESFGLHTRTGLDKTKELVYGFWKKFPVKYMRGLHNQNVDGEFIYDSKNVHNSYHIGGAENVRYSFNAFSKVADCYDYCVWGNGVELCYETLICGENVKNLRFCGECWPACSNLEYCFHCRSSSDCFGCVGIKKKQYCIFNKQYKKEEYESLRQKIVAQMDKMPYIDKKGSIYRYGEFLPSEFSPYAYNEASVSDFFPLTKKEAKEQGFIWRELSLREFNTTCDQKDIPDSIEEVEKSICRELIACGNCKRAYRIIPMEFSFYKRFKLPVPSFCPECRVQKRLDRFRPKMEWQERQCMCDYKVYNNFSKHNHHSEGPCLNKFLTTYKPGRGDIVYCERCYQVEVD